MTARDSRRDPRIDSSTAPWRGNRPAGRHNNRMPVGRIAWFVTTLMFISVAVALFASGYDGYGAVFMAVAAAAAVNLLPRPGGGGV